MQNVCGFLSREEAHKQEVGVWQIDPYAASIFDYVKYFHAFIQFKVFRVMEIIGKENRLFWNKPGVIC